ncbi:MAG TPA: hypothetical protein VE221_06205 [Sphingomicrobium sp.]|jgi:hypothetical protein|nr:hypothetical protein [Sphingomicrobium sp.]
MATRFWGTLQWPALAAPRLPERIPDLKRPWLYLFELFWFACLALAIVGPIWGTWYRFTTPGENSQLMLGSRAGLVLSQNDLTLVRFPVGSAAKAAGVEPGDKIIAIEGLPVARYVPLDPKRAMGPGHATDTDYALFSPIIDGGGQAIDLDLTLRSPAGEVRQFHVRTGEQHIDEAARSLHLTPAMLSIVDLFHILTYPFLLFAAWILHRRKREDLISSVLSLAVLLTIGSEQPSASFLSFIAQIPERWHSHLYDLGNICLIAGILLFPHGQLRPRIVIPFLALLPLLFVLNGYAYHATFIIFMIASVMTLLVRLRRMPPSAARQQIKWALLGFTGYALFLLISQACDITKLNVSSFGTQITLEAFAGLSFGLAFLCLQLGLLIALMRYRLYDAEVVIGRSVNVALITLGVAAVFAGTADAVKQLVLNYSGDSSAEGPVIFAAALSTVLVNPIQEWITRWSENRFQKNLVILRDELPDTVRDLRETANLGELVDEILARILKGVRTTHIAAIIDQGVFRVRGLSKEKVEEWQAQTPDWDSTDEVTHAKDKLFPIRIPLVPGQGEDMLGHLLIGPRPDGSVISHDEHKALKEVAEPIARAIRNVIRRVAYERRLESMIESTTHRLDELEARVNGPVVTAVPSSRSA